MYKALFVVLLALCPLFHGSLRAQQWEVGVSGTGASRQVQTTTVNTSAGNTIARDQAAALTVRCSANANCRNIKLRFEPQGEASTEHAPEGTATVDQVQFRIPGSFVNAGNTPPTFFELFESQTPILRFRVVNPPAPATPTPTAATGATATPAGGVATGTATTDPPRRKLADLVGTDCRTLLNTREPKDSLMYYAELDSAIFRTGATGLVVRRPGPIIDEDDAVTVQIVANELLLPSLRVFRKSPTRNADTVRIAGAGIKLPVGVLGQSENCRVVEVALHDFAPGEAEVQISAFTDDGNKDIGSFKFAVNPLYSGALTLGFVRTGVAAPSFGLIAMNADSVITDMSPDNARYLFTVFYTHFWRKRDFQKPRRGVEDFINPTVGVAVNDPRKNVFGGFSGEILRGLYITAGLHVAEVKALDPQSGLSIGSRFTGNRSQIPTVTRWTSKPFVSLSLDLRAAVQLLTSVATGK